MKEIKRIEGFKVDVLESVRAGKIWFTVRFTYYPGANAEAGSLPDAVAQLRHKWEDIKAAYRNGGLEPPKPPRSRGNQRALKTLRWLTSRPPLSPDVL